MALQLPRLLEEIPEVEEEEEEIIEVEQGFQFSIYPDQDIDKMAYDLSSEHNVLARAVFDITGKMIQIEVSSEFDSNTIGVASLKTGVYYLTIYLGDKVVSKPFFRK
jgi:hypothetical protein